jgi:hypothetical protein
MPLGLMKRAPEAMVANDEPLVAMATPRAIHKTVPFCPTKRLAGGGAEAIARRGCCRPFRVIKKSSLLTLISLD